MTRPLPPFTFDELHFADLDQVYQRGREEVLRDQVFSILLARTDTVEKLEQLVFAGEEGLARWTRKELIELSNRFRLLSSPENEIRLYQECQDEDFRRAPRVREFYVLALNKVGRPTEAIHEASRLIAEGGRNALLWGTLGEAYSAKMRFAEELAAVLRKANDEPSRLDPRLIARCAGHFPAIDPGEMSVARARALRAENLAAAIRMYHHGFCESGSSFTGLGWLLRMIDRLADLIIERGQLGQTRANEGLGGDEALRLRLIDAEIETIEQAVLSQVRLIDFALTLQGGLESLDYWTIAGILLLAVVQGADELTLRNVLSRLLVTADADFKLATTLAELQRMGDQYAAMLDVEQAHGRDTATLALRVQRARWAVAECEAGRARFKRTGSANDAGFMPAPGDGPGGEPVRPLTAFLDKTINFFALTGSLVPVFIGGS
ncbi:MAG TPA: hypothetical protein PKE45_25220, partial [Caldilineaceae bacterium]|nr:hypothetical protein [Caldilineaceae bacterium]